MIEIITIAAIIIVAPIALVALLVAIELINHVGAAILIVIASPVLLMGRAVGYVLGNGIYAIEQKIKGMKQ